MSSPEFFFDTMIRELHLDTFGHVNNAAYFSLFEDARWEVVTARGYGLETVQRLRQGPILLGAEIKFLRELRLRERIRIRTVCHPFEGRKTARIEQAMLKESGEVACEVSFTVAFFDLEARRLIPPTPAWLAATGLA